MRNFGVILLGIGLALSSGCKQREVELLVSYSGDCQGYFEPCG